MYSDISELAGQHELQADICVIGAGPAAISLALALRDTNLKVMLFESGGLGFDADNQVLAEGEQDGIPYFPLHESRYRLLGGSTYRWGARTSRFQPIDLTDRNWVEGSGWPLQRADLDPYYDRLPDLLALHAPFSYDEVDWSLFDTVPPDFDDSKLRFKPFQFGKNLLFGDVFRSALKSAPNLHLYYHATVTGLETNEAGDHIDHVRLVSQDGKGLVARARQYVLACGGIENARLLLLSNSTNPAGLCNENDLVGRYFMEHPTVSAGLIETDKPYELQRCFSPGLLRDRLVETGLTPTPNLQQDEGILNAVASVRFNVSRDPTAAFQEILWNFRHRRLPTQLNWYQKNKWLMERVGTVARNPFAVAANMARHVMGKPKRVKFDSMYLEIRTEQAPNPDSRVTLSDTTDRLGQPRARLSWAMTEQDKKTMQVMASVVGDELKRLGCGKLQMADWLREDDPTWPDDMVGGHHHMGTTRMSEDPQAGIVNADCRAHSVNNLYIAGSSVFPTASYVNPTGTIIALALRLADHLKSKAGTGAA